MNNTGEHNTEEQDSYWAQRVEDKEFGVQQERSRWKAAVEEMIKKPPFWRDDCCETSMADVLEELLKRMEADK